MFSHIERVSVARPEVFLDHRHESAHAVIVLTGEIVEDGRVYREGDIRWSSAADRHFLRFKAPVECLVVEAATWDGLIGTRIVRHDAGLARRVRAAVTTDQLRELLGTGCLSSPSDGRMVPSWLQELRRKCDAGEFVRTSGVEAVARCAGVSREHLARKFQSHFGTSVTSALRARRLRAAFDLMTGTRRSLTDIADACGFADQSHMTREVSQWIGVPPGALRRITSVQDAVPGQGVN